MIHSNITALLQSPVQFKMASTRPGKPCLWNKVCLTDDGPFVQRQSAFCFCLFVF